MRKKYLIQYKTPYVLQLAYATTVNMALSRLDLPETKNVDSIRMGDLPAEVVAAYPDMHIDQQVALLLRRRTARAVAKNIMQRQRRVVECRVVEIGQYKRQVNVIKHWELIEYIEVIDPEGKKRWASAGVVKRDALRADIRAAKKEREDNHTANGKFWIPRKLKIAPVYEEKK